MGIQDDYSFLYETSIIKYKNQFDILKIEKPDGINYDYNSEDVFGKLNEWDKKYSIQIIGADFDWLSFRLLKLRGDLNGFAEEIYDFCADSIDHGYESIDAMVEDTQINKTVFLWWSG